MNSKQPLSYYYDKVPPHSFYDVRMGLIRIACIWCPDARSKRDKYKVRLEFNQDLGLIDYSNDKDFDTLEQSKIYVEREFKKFIKDIGYHLGLWENIIHKPKRK